MAGENKDGYTIRENSSFEEALSSLGDVREIDDVLETLMFALSVRPDSFDLIPGFTRLRMAKTDSFVVGGKEIPGLRLTFRIVDDQTVELLWAEQIPEAAE